MAGWKEDVNRPRRMVVFAVFDIIDRLGGEYQRAMAGDIQAKLTVLGKASEYAFAVTAVTAETSILHISLLHPLQPLTVEEKRRSVEYLLHRVLLHIAEA